MGQIVEEGLERLDWPAAEWYTSMVWKMEEKVAKLMMTFNHTSTCYLFTSSILTCHKDTKLRGQIVDGRSERLVWPAAEWPVDGTSQTGRDKTSLTQATLQDRNQKLKDFATVLIQ